MASQTKTLHFVLIPYLCNSHILPLVDFAKTLAQSHVNVTILTTPLNAITIQSTVQKSHLKIHILTVPFPSQAVGLPHGCENMETLPSHDMVSHLYNGCKMLQAPMTKLLMKLQPTPNCIISTSSLPWTSNIASSLGIPRYAFQTISCFTMLVSHNIGRMNVHNSVGSDSEPFVVQGMPGDEVVLTKSQMPQMPTKTGKEDMSAIIAEVVEAQRLTRGMVVNTFEEMEPRYVEAFKNMEKIWCVGPVSLCNKEMSDKLVRGGVNINNNDSVGQNVCLKWLDSMELDSVIYACFGSAGIISSAQVIETGLGLEASNRPFIWVIRERDISNEVGKWLADYKLEERVKGRGLIIRGWAPQVLILSHPSVGGFITHCGWNSTLEAVCAGVPMVTWPMFAEQFYNEKLVVNVLKIGVRVGVEVIVKNEDGMNKVYVSKEQVKEAIEKLMDGEEKGVRIKRAKVLSEMAMKATEEGGSSFLNIIALIQDVIEQISAQ